jgi:hypothetical protein
MNALKIRWPAEGLVSILFIVYFLSKLSPSSKQVRHLRTSLLRLVLDSSSAHCGPFTFQVDEQMLQDRYDK